MENKTQENKKFHFTFVRHGQSMGNSEGLIQGQSHTALSSEGREQSKLAGLALSHIKFDQIYSSDLDRAFDTAAIIANENKLMTNGLSDENSNSVQKNELLRERCFGVFELRPSKEFRAAAEKSGFTQNDLYNFVPEGGESLSDVRNRGKEFLDFIFKSNKRTSIPSNMTYNILVVSHSGFLKQMGNYLFSDCKAVFADDFNFSDGFTAENYLGKLSKNTGISTFEVEVDKDKKIHSVKCTKYACSKHLENVAKNKCDD